MFFHTFSFFAFFIWDPSRFFFVMPFLNHPITWYGFLFASSFFVSYFIVRHLFRQIESLQKNATLLTDRLSVFVVLGTVMGARLAHVLFYEWDYYSHHLVDIFKVWEGGLASHGGAAGILIAIFVFSAVHRKHYPVLTPLAVIDVLAIPTCLVAGCIRVGNFINQEILGTPTTLPWGVIYLHPAQPVERVPVHPVQLYEALIYFCCGLFLWFLWKKRGKKIGEGLLAGWLLTLVFGARFWIEFIKLPQSAFDVEHWVNMGQLLSLPFVALGIFLIIRGYVRRR